MSSQAKSERFELVQGSTDGNDPAGTLCIDQQTSMPVRLIPSDWAILRAGLGKRPEAQALFLESESRLITMPRSKTSFQRSSTFEPARLSPS
jgi:hypothetical protein